MKRTMLVILLLTLGACAATPPEPIEEFGTPDLAIQAFVPPIIFAGVGDTIYVSDLTSNIGRGRSPETTVQYYISDRPLIDVSSAIVLGVRKIRSLAANERDESLEVPFVIPEGSGQPPLFLAACIDIDNEVEEVYEENNCTTNRTGIHEMPFDTGVVVPIGVIPGD